MTNEHHLVTKLRQQLVDREIDRRHFLRYATMLGLPAVAAYAFADKIVGTTPAAADTLADMPVGGRLVIGMGLKEVATPHTQSWVQQANVVTQVAETLSRTGADNLTRPHLAASWKVSEDVRSWTIRLRPEAKYHSGRPFLADDMIWNLRHVMDPSTGSAALAAFKPSLLKDEPTGALDDAGNPIMTSVLWDANAIEKIDDYTVRLNCKKPHFAIPEDLALYVIVMLDPEEDGKWGGGKYGDGGNATGAFKLVDHQPSRRSVLQANRDYYGNGPFIDELIFADLGDSPSAYLAAAASRQIDGVYQLDVASRRVARRFSHLKIYQAATALTAVVQIRIKQKPFDHPGVRLAMRYAMDPAAVLQIAHENAGLPAEHHFVYPGHPSYAPLPKMQRDVPRAKALLAEAGYPNGIDIEIHTKNSPVWELKAVQVIQQQYAEADIRMRINSIPSSAFWDQWDRFPLAFVEWTHRPLATTVLALGFRSGVPWNATDFANPGFDLLLEQAESTIDVGERREIMKNIEIIMQQDGPIAQPLWRSRTSLMARRVKNYQQHPTGYIFANELAIEA